MNRMTAHRKALAAHAFCGISRSQRVNPASSLKIERTYASPILMSGLASVILTRNEIDILNHHHLRTLCDLLRLYRKTPRSAILFLAGSLPASAILNLRQLGLFGMITRLKENILYQHAKAVLTVMNKKGKSWFLMIRDLCLKYELPHPLQLLEYPPSKETYKKLINAHVIDYWELQLRGEASLLSTLSNFHPEYMSLKNPHPLWTCAGSNPYEVSKATIQAKMLSGQYRTENFCRFLSGNQLGTCLAPACGSPSPETINHLLPPTVVSPI